MIDRTKYITQREGIIFILSAPSGTGKTTVIKGLQTVYPDIKLSISFTTRTRRAGEIHGRDYYFVKSTKFAAMKANGDFAEGAEVHDFFLATPLRPLDRCVRGGPDIFLVIDFIVV